MTTEDQELAQVDQVPVPVGAYYACTLLSMLCWGANLYYIIATPSPSKLLQLIALLLGMLAHQYRNIYTSEISTVFSKVIRILHILVMLATFGSIGHLIWQVARDFWQSIY